MAYLDSDLARVEKQIAEALQRIARQRKLIERLREHHHDTTSAEQLLKVMAQTLKEFEVHRSLIEDELLQDKGGWRGAREED